MESKLATDDAVLEQLGQRLSAHRLARNLTQARLAREAGVSKSTVERLEAGQSSQLSSLVRVLRALELLSGIDALVPELPASPVARWRNRGRERRRASRETPERSASPTWHWDDEA